MSTDTDIEREEPASIAEPAVEEPRERSETHPTDSYAQYLEQGKEYTEANELYKARDAFQSAARVDPEQLEPQLWLSRLAYRARDWRDLHARSASYLRVRPDHREMLVLHARACNGLADWPAAATAWRGVADDRPDWPEARYQQARAAMRSGNHEEAADVARALIAMNETPADALGYAVRIQLELGDLAGARTTFAILFQDHRDIASREHDALDAEDDLRGGAVALRARLDVDGETPELDDKVLTVSDALFRRAIAFERAADLMEAFFDYEALLFLSPTDGLAERSCARLARQLQAVAQKELAGEDLAQAAEAFARAVRAAPLDLNLRRAYGRVLMRNAQWPDAARVWRGFAAAAPEDREAAIQLARALDRSGRLPEAVGAWRSVLERFADNEEAGNNLSTIVRRMIFAGRTAIAEERFVDAYGLFKAALAEDPDNEEAVRRLAQVGRNLLKSMRADYKARDLRLVLASADAAKELMPEDPEVQLLIGRSASGMRRYQLALAAWNRLGEIEPAQATLAKLQAARCHLHLGDGLKAEAIVDEVLAAEPTNPEAQDLLERVRGAD